MHLKPLWRHLGLRLFVLGVHDEPAVVGQMMGAGVAGFVLQRAAATDLVPAVEEVLGGTTKAVRGSEDGYLNPGGDRLQWPRRSRRWNDGIDLNHNH
jgi:DNA-binding NarL/FixJ family response regulator